MKPIIKFDMPLLAIDTLYYAVGLILANILSFAIFPILARGLSINDFGVFDLLSSFSILISIIFAFGIDSAVGRFFYEYNETNIRKSLVTESFIIQLSIIIIFSFSFIFLAEYFISFISTDSRILLLFKYTVIQAAFQAIVNFSLSLLKWTLDKWMFILLAIASSGISLFFIVISIFVFNTQLIDLVKYIVFGKVITSLLGIYLVRKWFIISNLSFNYYSKLLRYAFPIGVICIIEVVIPTFERQTILSIINSEQLGIYAAAAKFVSILSVIIQAFQTAWGPFSLSIRKQDNVHETYSLSSKVFVFVLCMGVLLITFIGKFALICLISDRYTDSYVLIFPIAMSIAIQSLGLIFGMGINISMRPYYQLISYSIFVFASFFLIGLLTKNFGIIGTAYAVLIASFFRILVISILSHYSYPIRWPFLSIIAFFCLTFITGYFFSICQTNFGIYINSTFIFTSLFILGFCFWYFILTAKERSHFQNLF